MVNSKFQRRRNANLSQSLLAACVASTLLLTACDSAPNTPGSAAAQASNRAARLAVSAGEVRPKEEFAKSLEGKDDAEIRQTGDSAAKAIAADKLNEKGVWKNYLEQKSVAADLDTAAGFLSDALKDEGLADPALKSVVQAQLARRSLRRPAFSWRKRSGSCSTSQDAPRIFRLPLRTSMNLAHQRASRMRGPKGMRRRT